jgi:Tol biopolymer transport system component
MAIKTKVGASLIILALGAAALAYQWPPCSGVRGCYQLLTRIEDGRTRADDHRHVLMSHFAASSAAIVFSVAVDDRSVGLVVIDRHSSTQRLIVESSAHFGSPYLSPDGQRLVMVKSSFETPQRQVLSCQTATWRCTVLLHTENSVFSPVEIDKNTILFSSSPAFIRSDGGRRYFQYDLYLAEKGAAPVRLTDFKLSELGWLSMFNNQIVFGASGGSHHPALPEYKLNQTEIYSVNYDPQRRQVLQETPPLKSLFQMSTYSIRPSVSADGRRIAFENVEIVKGGRYRYDMAIATLDGNLQQRVKLEGIEFSRGAFVADTLIFNELFKDHYRVRQLDLAKGSVADILTIDHSGQAFENLDRIKLQFEDDSVRPQTHAMRSSLD